jgi:chromosome segregation ATPase
MLDLLKLDLQYFSADDGGAGGSGGSGDWIDEFYGETEGNKDSSKDNKDENMIPKSRFDSVNTKFKELSEASKTKQAEYEELQKSYDAEVSSKSELEEGVKARDSRIEALEGVLKGMLDAELEQIDEELRELVPSDKPIEEQLQWFAKAKQKGLFGVTTMEYEIGGMSNPGKSAKGSKGYEGMNPIQLFTMGYGSK